MHTKQTSIKTEKTSMPLTSQYPTEPMVPSMTKRPRPHLDQTQTQTLQVHCPRCDSTHTKFCYYNNYSLSQPRYFCKSCRRYWTKGGTLRNIPVGGGTPRKNKKLSSVSTTHHHRHRHEQQPQQNSHYNKLAIYGNSNSENSIGLQRSYPESPAQLSADSNFMFENLNGGVGGGGGNCEGDDHFPAISGYGADSGNTHGLSPFGEMMSYYEKMMNVNYVKPKVLDLEWLDYQTPGSSAERNLNGSFGFLLDLHDCI